jgi:hypothetical protein
LIVTIVYDSHLKERLQERNIPQEWPREIVEQPEEVYQDTLTDVYIAIGKRQYKGKEREMAVSYIKREAETLIITIHPVRPAQKRNRVERGRWIKT